MVSLVRNVVCMKWGTKYGPEYVNRLYGMLLRNLTGPFRLVCFTDDIAGIRSEVQCQPIPALNLPPDTPERGWTKLVSYRKGFGGLDGDVLFLDLDVVVVGSLDELFTFPGDFLIIHDYKRTWRVTGNSSVYRYKMDANADVLDHFESNHEQIRKRYRNEQEYLSHYLHERGRLQYWPKAWCPSFKYQCIPRWPSNFWIEPRVPAQSKVIVFHGECNPPDALAGRRNRRFRFMKPASWVADYWKE